MGLNNALIIASQSLGTISSQINVVSRNISGAGTDDITKKTAIVATGVNGGIEFKGIRRTTNEPIFKYLLASNSKMEKTIRISDALNQIDLFFNMSDPAESRAPAMMMARLSDSILNYTTSPDDRVSAELVVEAAREVLSSVQDASGLMRDLRRQADDNIAASVDMINNLLAKISDVNREIVSLKDTETDTTDMMDQRDGLLRDLSRFIGIKTVVRPNQDLVIYADNGSTLLETSPRQVTFERTDQLSAGASGNSVYIDGVRSAGPGASSPLGTGSVVGDIYVRDNLTSIHQAQLDEISRVLIIAFAETDQSGAGGDPLPGLFTRPDTTTIPGNELVSGLADQIMINPSVDPNQGGNAMLLRDGGMSGNSAFVYNKDGFEGFTRRLYELAEVSDISRTYDPKAGLDLNGTLKGFMESSIGWIGGQRQNALRERTYQSATLSQSILTLSNTTGVNIDEQMTHMLTLENAFQASAKLLQTINEVYDSLFAAIGR